MASTTKTTVASHIASEVMSQVSLAPLRHRFAALPWLNAFSLDGKGPGPRKIPKRVAIAKARVAVEDVNFSGYEQQTYATPISLTPVPYEQGVNTTIAALRAVFPGATREAVVRAAKENDPKMIPLLVAIFEELIQSHYIVAEENALALFPSFTLDCGTTNTALDLMALISGQMELFDQDEKPDHRALVCILGMKAITDLRVDMMVGDSAPAALFGAGYGVEFLTSVGTPPSQAPVPFGNLLGMPIVESDSSLMALANADVDNVGAIMLVGKGETGAPGSLRGAIEHVEGHALAVDMEFDLEADAVKSIGRWEHVQGIHTNPHGCKVIYKAAA